MSNEVVSAQPREMGMTLKAVADRVNLVHQILNKVMMKGTHYGTVPGCGDKMVLLKPGADLLAMTFRLVTEYSVTKTDLANGHREYDVTCSMRGVNGELLGQGVGSASTMEKKYRYRKVYSETGKKKDAYGKRYDIVENEDIADVYNTVLKIAKKRAHIDGTLTVTGAADLFTQDLIDEDDLPKTPVKMPTAKKSTQPSKEQGQDNSNDAGDHSVKSSAPVPSFDRDEMISKIDVLIAKTKPVKLEKIAKAVGIEWEQFYEVWTNSTDEQLKSLESLLRC